MEEDKLGMTVYVEDIENETDRQKIAYFPKGERTKAELLETIHSPDGKKFATLIKVETIDSLHIYMVTFNEEKKAIGQIEIDLNTNHRGEEYVINNHGEILFLTISDNDPKKKDKKQLAFEFRKIYGAQVVNSHSITGIVEDNYSAVILPEGDHFFVDILLNHREKVANKEEYPHQLYQLHFGPQLKW
jgi:hypothetical protein